MYEKTNVSAELWAQYQMIKGCSSSNANRYNIRAKCWFYTYFKSTHARSWRSNAKATMTVLKFVSLSSCCSDIIFVVCDVLLHYCAGPPIHCCLFCKYVHAFQQRINWINILSGYICKIQRCWLRERLWYSRYQFVQVRSEIQWIIIAQQAFWNEHLSNSRPFLLVTVYFSLRIPTWQSPAFYTY